MVYKIKYRTTDEIDIVVDKFRKKHKGYSAIPIDVERIVEKSLDIQIVPLEGLKRLLSKAGLEGDAHITADYRIIFIDHNIYWNRNQNRCRFSLSHEIGHRVLHQDFTKQYSYKTITEWIEVVKSLPEQDSRSLEWQANQFAGSLLVPTSELQKRLPSACRIAIQEVLLQYPGIDEDFPDIYVSQVTREVEKSLAKTFEVSQASLSIRLECEKMSRQIKKICKTNRTLHNNH